MPDLIERICGALVQHGAHNDRIYVMHPPTSVSRSAELVAALDALSRRRRYGKILAKIPAYHRPVFDAAGYVREAVIPGFFRGDIDGWLMARYPSRRRQTDPLGPRLKADLAALGRSPRGADGRSASHLPVIPCGPEDASAMAALYRRVFASYPFPIGDPVFLRRQMASGVHYAGIRRRGRLVALAAAEIDAEAGAGEMTDFATLKPCRGRGMAGRLLAHLDHLAAAKGVITGYTIARAASPGMNRAFHRRGYQYGGYLPNNTQIGGRIESMSVWYKPLASENATPRG